MGLNDILLSTELLADLYENALLMPVADRTTASVSPGPGYPVLGGHKKNICLVVDCPGSPFLPEKHLLFITRMLEACRLSIDDTAILNQASGTLRIEKIREQLSSEKILLFGVDPDQLGIGLPLTPFESGELGGCRIFYFPSLDEINQTTAEGRNVKGKLWAVLQKIFELQG
jgi:hypothetical protein